MTDSTSGVVRRGHQGMGRKNNQETTGKFWG